MAIEALQNDASAPARVMLDAMLWVTYARHTWMAPYDDRPEFQRQLQAVAMVEQILASQTDVFVDATLVSEVVNRLLKLGRNRVEVDALLVANRLRAARSTVSLMLRIHTAGRLAFDSPVTGAAVEAVDRLGAPRLFNDACHYLHAAAEGLPLYTWDADYAALDAALGGRACVFRI